MAMAYHEYLDYLGGFDDDVDDWWDEYALYQEENDAYWARYYAKIYYNLPDGLSVFKANQSRNFYHPSHLSPNEEVTYEKLHSVIRKTEILFSLWQKRLSHEWNKDIVVPWKANRDVPGLKLEMGNDKSEEKGKVEEENEAPVEENEEHHICPHISMAVNALEQFGFLHDFLPPFFSDEEDSYSYYDDSDDWLSLDEEPYYSDDDLFAHSLRVEARKEAHRDKRNALEESESKARYQESARKFYIAFSDAERFEEVASSLLDLKIWVNNLFAFILSKSLGRQLPQLVIEKILQYLLNRHGELQLNIGCLAKTQRFIDLEKSRLRELYAAILEIHRLFFEILFKNELVSKQHGLRENTRKLFQIASRKFVMVQELKSWLWSEESSLEGSPPEDSEGFLSGLYYCKSIKASGRDISCLLSTNVELSSFDGRYLAIMMPDFMKESFVKVFDVTTSNFVMLHDIAKGDTALGVALNNNDLALMLKRNGCCWIEIRGVLGRAYRKPIRLTLGITKKEVARKMSFVEFEASRKLLVQKDNDVVIIDVSMDNGVIALSVEKTYHQQELLAAKGQYMITRDFIEAFTSAKEVSESDKAETGIRVFDVRSDSLLTVISQKNEGDVRGAIRWSATMDTDPNSLKFILWKDSQLELWKIDGEVKKMQDINLGSRVSSGTKVIFNQDIIAVHSLQESHDSSYEKVELAEILFYEISTGRTYYHETYHRVYDKPESHTAIAGGHLKVMYMTRDMLISLHSATSGLIRIYNFGLSHEKIMGLQIKDLAKKRREEERRRQIKEAEKKRLNEERMKKKEEQRLKRLNKKIKQKEAQQKRRRQIENLKLVIKDGTYCVGSVVEWRGSYGFLEIDGIGSVFIHITDIQGKPRDIAIGCRIRCQLQEQIVYSRPKAVSASVIRTTGIPSLL